MATLCLLDENGAIARRWEVGKEPVSVGRDDSAEVMLEDDSLSRRHFIVFREKDGYSIQDLDSQNGTWVDGKRTHTTKLKHHDCIVAGRTVFLFDERPVTGKAPAASSLLQLNRANAAHSPALPASPI
jgi:pSer/pThr/pTyr-binding forkhead associated (FHA) protein